MGEHVGSAYKPLYEKTIRIGQDGKIVCVYTSEEKLRSKFDFTWYPFDTQEFMLPTVLVWKTDKWLFNMKRFTSTKVHISDWKVFPQYDEPFNTSFPLPATGTMFNCTLAMTPYLFKRPLGNHFFQTFIPSMMLSLASAASVFIPSNIVDGRMGLCITTFLSLISLFNGARNDWTKTTHMRAIDVWVIFCYIGVFSALMEYCIILYLTKTSIFDQKPAQVKCKEEICLNQEEEEEKETQN